MTDQPTPAHSGTPPAPQSKKRPRLTALTPVGILRQRKKRAGAPATAGTPATQRRSVSGTRPGAQTPTKPRALSGSAATTDSGEGRDGRVLGQAAASEPRAGSAAVQPTGNEVAAEIEQEEGEADEDDGTIMLVRQSKEEVGELWDQMSDEQRQRYGAYRRSALNKATVKKLVSQILNQPVSSTLTFVVAGFAKVFVGEIVERAIQIQTDRGQEGALTPEHLREAYRLYRRETLTVDSTATGFTKRLF
ncbi:transcription initiation factor TFIID subunit 11 [Coemansia biformis]|uniref:Transcription initiation factor TFIID subunit 11 n=1 Tax=Coemansia biformis TaxID=1286918 RepID=A0A9W7YD60_9FUNG|nr:transcription initiation factor TFIID subunit 11 [Coemansia biformis]